MASENVSLKVVVHKGTQKVLYAEAPKEFVDFLLQLFSLPLGSVNKLLGSKQMVGGLSNLKESIESFNEIYFEPGINKDSIFTSKTTFNGNMFSLLDDASAKNNAKPATSTRKVVYTCAKHREGSLLYCTTVTENPTTKCPNCYSVMNVPLNVIGNPMVVKEAEKGGFVKDVVTYMVMDDLVVKPMPTTSCITLLNSIGVKDLSKVEEKTLLFGKDEALKLLEALCLSTNEVLTTLFLPTKYANTTRKRSKTADLIRDDKDGLRL